MLSSILRRPAVAAVGAAAAIALLAGCGSGDGGTGKVDNNAKARPSASGKADNSHNLADVTFATDMIGHHRQAVMMAKLAPERAATTELKELAAKIAAAQQPEIDTMSGWLRAWGRPVPPQTMDHGAAGHQGMPGMMTPKQMDELNAQVGMDFEKMFYTMMIAHHEGAIVMAKSEQRDGKNPEAKALAAKIVQDQTAEIAKMKQLR
jgi:uncharacterized protein (DUF305 family)